MSSTVREIQKNSIFKHKQQKHIQMMNKEIYRYMIRPVFFTEKTIKTTSDETDQDTNTYKNGRNTRHKSKVGDTRNDHVLFCRQVHAARCCGLSWWLCSGGCGGACVATSYREFFRPYHPVTLEALFPKPPGRHVFFAHCSCMLDRGACTNPQAHRALCPATQTSASLTRSTPSRTGAASARPSNC